jgi:TRAP-type C4-dicarboxylate transport system permease small subunit
MNPSGEADPLADIDHGDIDAFSPNEDPAAAAGRWLCQVATVGLVGMMVAEMIVRSLFGWSIQWSNEIGGYALIAITFLSLASGQYLHAYHRVHFIENRLSATGKALLRGVFDLASLVVALVLLLEFVRFEWITWRSADVASTALMTPLWMPRLAMPLGAALLVWALLRTLAADWRRLRAARAMGS